MNLKMCEKVASLYLRSALNEINTKMSKNSNTLSIHILFRLKVNSSEISRDISIFTWIILSLRDVIDWMLVCLKLTFTPHLHIHFRIISEMTEDLFTCSLGRVHCYQTLRNRDHFGFLT